MKYGKFICEEMIYGIWTESVHNLRGLLDSVKDNTQQAELNWLEFHANWAIDMLYTDFW